MIILSILFVNYAGKINKNGVFFMSFNKGKIVCSICMVFVMGSVMGGSYKAEAADWSRLGSTIGGMLKGNRNHNPKGVAKVLANGVKYQIVEIEGRYDNAYRYAMDVGGHLAVIETAYENKLLYDFMVSQKITSAYFGLADHMFNGTWHYSDGRSPKYTNWKKGEPNRDNKRNMYAKLEKNNKKGEWCAGTFRKEIGSDEKVHFIIEWPNEAPASVTAPQTKPVYKPAPVYVPSIPDEDVIS